MTFKFMLGFYDGYLPMEVQAADERCAWLEIFRVLEQKGLSLLTSIELQD